MVSCKSVANVTSQIWENHNRHVKKAAAVAAAAGQVQVAAAITAGVLYAETAKKAIEFWNAQVNQSWARVGPRQLTYNTKITGTVQSVGQRMLIAPYPATGGPVELEFTKLDGKAEVEVRVCKFTPKNNHTLVEKISISPRTPDGRSWTVEIPKNNLVTVLISSKSAFKKLQWAVKATTAKSKKKSDFRVTKPRATIRVRSAEG